MPEKRKYKLIPELFRFFVHGECFPGNACGAEQRMISVLDIEKISLNTGGICG